MGFFSLYGIVCSNNITIYELALAASVNSLVAYRIYPESNPSPCCQPHSSVSQYKSLVRQT